VQDGDAHVAVLVDVGVPHLGGELDGGRAVGVVGGEVEGGLEVAALVEGVGRAEDGHLPLEQVVVRQPHREPLQRLLRQPLQLLLQRLRRRAAHHFRHPDLCLCEYLCEWLCDQMSLFNLNATQRMRETHQELGSEKDNLF